MAFNLQAYVRASARIDNTMVEAGSLERPYNFSASGLKYELTQSIANAANATIWNAQLSGFTFMLVESDYPVRLKLTDTNSNTFSLWLAGTNTANRYGMPLPLGNDNTTSTYIINSIQAFNTSGSTAKVHIIAIN